MTQNLERGLEKVINPDDYMTPMGIFRKILDKHKGTIAGAVMGVAAATNPGVANAQTEIAYNQSSSYLNNHSLQEKYRNVPSGVMASVDENVPYAWTLWHEGRELEAKEIMGIDVVRGQDPLVRVNSRTPQIDVGYWLAAAKMGIANEAYGQYAPKDSAMRHFASAMLEFDYRYISKDFDNTQRKLKSEKGLEEDFTKAILIASGRPESDYKEFEKMNFNDKIDFMRGLIVSLDSKSRLYKQIFVASNYMLAIHNSITKGKKDPMTSLHYSFELKGQKVAGISYRDSRNFN